VIIGDVFAIKPFGPNNTLGTIGGLKPASDLTTREAGVAIVIYPGTFMGDE